jgi:hypothetical protein
LATIFGNEFGVENSRLHDFILFLVIFAISIERYCVIFFLFYIVLQIQNQLKSFQISNMSKTIVVKILNL